MYFVILVLVALAILCAVFGVWAWMSSEDDDDDDDDTQAGLALMSDVQRTIILTTVIL